MKGYFITDDQVSNLKERLEWEKLRPFHIGDASKKEIIEAVALSMQKRVMIQVEDWVKSISK